MSEVVYSVAAAELSGKLGDRDVLLDVREPDEWDQGHAPTARHIPMLQVADRLAELDDADAIYVVCRQGGRSIQVTKLLTHFGYDATNVTGGMVAWQKLGLPLVDGRGEPGWVY